MSTHDAHVVNAKLVWLTAAWETAQKASHDAGYRVQLANNDKQSGGDDGHNDPFTISG